MRNWFDLTDGSGSHTSQMTFETKVQSVFPVMLFAGAAYDAWGTFLFIELQLIKQLYEFVNKSFPLQEIQWIFIID